MRKLLTIFYNLSNRKTRQFSRSYYSPLIIKQNSTSMMISLALLLTIGPMHFSIINVDGRAEAQSLFSLGSPEVLKELSMGCDEVIYLSDTYIVPAYYQALTQIIAVGTILNGSTVFRAGEEIILAEGFEVRAGATLEIDIGPCIF